jgi:hypothetical protein
VPINWTFPQEAWDRAFALLDDPDDFLLLVENGDQAGPSDMALRINLERRHPECGKRLVP